MPNKKTWMLLVLLIFTLPISGQAENRRDHRGNPSGHAENRRDHRMSLQDTIKQVAPFKEWMIGANSRGVIDAVVSRSAPPSSFYNMKGLKNKKFLQYERQGVGRGINLGWTNNATASTAHKRSKWIFVPRDQSKRVGERDKGASIRSRPIRYGEKIAIAWVERRKSSGWDTPGKWKFIKYAHRNVGINLDWSNQPSYEWTILGGKPGKPVGRGKDWVVIYNHVNKQPLIYYPRNLGGNIGWPNSKGGDFGGPVTLKKKTPPQYVWKKLMM